VTGRRGKPVTKLSGVCQGWSGGLDPALRCRLQRAFEGELNLTGRLLAGFPVRHDAGPFDDLGDITLVPSFGRIPDADFVIASLPGIDE
jgi:hypothetical protein